MKFLGYVESKGLYSTTAFYGGQTSADSAAGVKVSKSFFGCKWRTVNPTFLKVGMEVKEMILNNFCANINRVLTQLAAVKFIYSF